MAKTNKTAETAISKSELAEQKRLLKQGILSFQKGLVARVVATYNIVTHKLYEADGHKSFKAFCEENDLSYDTAMKHLFQGKQLALAMNGNKVPDDFRLSLDHMQMYLDAKKKLQPRQLTSGKNAVDAEYEIVGAEVSQVVGHMEKIPDRRYRASTPSKRSKEAEHFIKSFELPSIHVDDLLRCVFVSVHPRMKKEFHGLSKEDQAEVILYAKRRIGKS